LIGEKILNKDGAGPRWALMQSLNMIVCTEGRERTMKEYGELLSKAGFQTAVGVRTQVPLDGILAIKP
jgi:acetylserotonin N-methyltransferase